MILHSQVSRSTEMKSAEKNKKYAISRKQFLMAGAGSCAFCIRGLSAHGGSEQDMASSSSQSGQRGFVSPAKASWFRQVDDNTLECLLCPNACLLEEGQRSVCRVRENRNGQGYTLAFGNPALIQEDPVERKPFFHVVPGSRALSVSTAGCNLSCKFCEVWDMALVKPEDVYAYDMPAEEVVAMAQASQVRSVSFAFGEPVVFHEYMIRIAGLARDSGMLNLVHTGGYIRPEPLRALCKVIDAANVDLKGFDPDFYRQYVGGDIKVVLDTLLAMKKSGIHVEVTAIVIPTLNDDPRTISRMCSWIVGELGPDTPLHFARFYPLYRLSGLPRTPVSTLDMARDTAREEGLNHVYVAKVTGHEGENTFCPGCGEMIISRLGFIVEQVRVSQGRCDLCGHDIPGIWN